MFKNLFSFEGRIRRTEFGISVIIFVLLSTIISVIVEINKALVIVFLAYIPLYWFLWSQSAKRCHDRGNSGWYQLIPFYGLWLLFGKSDHGENDYGLNPKGIGNEESVTRDPQMNF